MCVCVSGVGPLPAVLTLGVVHEGVFSLVLPGLQASFHTVDRHLLRGGQEKVLFPPLRKRPTMRCVTWYESTVHVGNMIGMVWGSVAHAPA